MMKALHRRAKLVVERFLLRSLLTGRAMMKALHRRGNLVVERFLLRRAKFVVLLRS